LLLHPTVEVRVSAHFLRGVYDTSVFEAFREVEVAVRDAAGLAMTDVGVDLMRRAFGPGGPLADPSGHVPSKRRYHISSQARLVRTRTLTATDMSRSMPLKRSR